MRKALGAWLLGALVVVSLVGCTSQEEEPVIGDIPSVPDEGAELVCGMDRTHLEAALGVETGRIEDDLDVEDGVGSGQCTVWWRDESRTTSPLLFVTFFPASSQEGLEARARVDGDGYPPPDVPFDSVDGGAWGGLEPEPGSATWGSTSRVFFEETVVVLSTANGGTDRDPAGDLLALTQQVAASYGLGDAQQSP
jgi:hypothetical protein